MKHIIFFIFLCTATAHAQEGFRIEYQIRFNDQFDRGRADRQHTGYLFINNSESRFYMVQKSAYVPKDERDISLMTDTTNLVYVSQGKGLLIAEQTSLKGKGYLVSDSLFPMAWEFPGEEKMIDSLTCTKATCYFRGRYYTAWFTTDIPLPFGPWKMGGLPGLIVDLQDKDENMVVRFSGMARNEGAISIPTNVSLTYNDHIGEIRKFLKRLKANSRANGSGDCLTCQQESKLELFSWEKIPE